MKKKTFDNDVRFNPKIELGEFAFQNEIFGSTLDLELQALIQTSNIQTIEKLHFRYR
jgi:hypothetical protein